MKIQVRPHLADIQPTRVKFKPGDRVLVMVIDDLDPIQRMKIKRGVEKFAGVPVRVLILNCTRMKVFRSRVDEVDKVLCSRLAASAPTRPGMANMNCSIVDIRPNDRITVFLDHHPDGLQKGAVEKRFKEWTGNDVEIVVMKGPV